jgi:hypothetical protein
MIVWRIRALSHERCLQGPPVSRYPFHACPALGPCVAVRVARTARLQVLTKIALTGGFRMPRRRISA